MSEKPKTSRPPAAKGSNTKDSKTGEQILLEDIARRKFNTKWGKYVELTNFYDRKEIDRKLREKLNAERRLIHSPLVYNGHGESFFVSRDMYEAMAICRCGERRSGVHLVNCLETTRTKHGSSSGVEIKLPRIPQKASEMVGLPHNFLTWERSTYYVSPKCFVEKSAKVGLKLFNQLIIG